MYNNNNENNDNESQNFLERHFGGISIKSFRKWTYSYEKKSVLHTAILTHCTARQVLRDPFSTNQWNNLEMTFVEESTRNQSQKFENQAMIG